MGLKWERTPCLPQEPHCFNGGSSQNTLEFFFNKGNDGCNALRELLEDFNEDTVDFEYESNEKEYLITLRICYQYHDFDVQCVKQFDNERPTVYKIIDTYGEFINQIKTEFNLRNRILTDLIWILYVLFVF